MHSKPASCVKRAESRFMGMHFRVGCCRAIYGTTCEHRLLNPEKHKSINNGYLIYAFCLSPDCAIKLFDYVLMRFVCLPRCMWRFNLSLTSQTKHFSELSVRNHLASFELQNLPAGIKMCLLQLLPQNFSSRHSESSPDRSFNIYKFFLHE